MQDENSQIIRIANADWYVETPTGFDGPFESKKEAISFIDLVRSSNAARIEFAGLQYSP